MAIDQTYIKLKREVARVNEEYSIIRASLMIPTKSNLPLPPSYLMDDSRILKARMNKDRAERIFNDYLKTRREDAA